MHRLTATSLLLLTIFSVSQTDAQTAIESLKRRPTLQSASNTLPPVQTLPAVQRAVPAKADDASHPQAVANEIDRAMESIRQTASDQKTKSETFVFTLPPKPRFQNRVWRDINGDTVTVGKPLGVSKDAVWIHSHDGSVLRKPLAELHVADRKHAVEKRRAILDYRRLKKLLEN